MQSPSKEPRSLQIAVEAMPVAVSWARLSDQKIIFMNRKFTEIFGYSLEDFPDITSWINQTYLFAEDRARVAETWGAYLATGATSEVAIEQIEIRVLCKDGAVKTVLHGGVILPNTGWALATFVDISERKINELRIQAAERQAAENESIYKLLLDHSPEMIILSPFDASRRYVSPAVERMTGFTAEEYLAFEKLEMIHPKDRETARGIIVKLRQGNLVLTFRYRTLQKEGGYCWVEATVNGYLDPVSRQVAGYVAVIRDISMEKEREEQLASEHLRLTEAASLDELTGIPNRRAFNRAIEGEARRHTRETSELSLMMVDVDYFKRYNDFYGHVAGDACLRSVATALKAIVNRAADMVARFGGEEFVVLLPMTKAPGAERIARKIQQAICSLAIPHSESPYGTVTVSIGIATWQSEIAVSESLLVEQADRALYQAKERGRNQYVVG